MKLNIDELKGKNKKLIKNIESIPKGCCSQGKHKSFKLYKKVKKNERLIKKFEKEIVFLAKKKGNIPSEYYYLHGNILFKADLKDDAILQYKKAIEINPNSKQAYTNLITTLIMKKNVNEANKYWVKSLKHKVQINKDLVQYLKQNSTKNNI